MSDDAVTIGSGNIFEDLGFEDPEGELLKVKLGREIRLIVERRGLSQDESAVLFDMTGDEAAAILAGRSGKSSIDRLVHCLERLDYTVDLVVRRRANHMPSAFSA